MKHLLARLISASLLVRHSGRSVRAGRTEAIPVVIAACLLLSLCVCAPAEASDAILPSTVAPQVHGLRSNRIPAKFFGLTVLSFKTLSPNLPYGTARTWDSYPNLDWAEVNTAKGVYDFTYVDAFLVANQGRNVIYTLGRTPRWASSKPDAPGSYGAGQCAAPADLRYWDDYLRAIAKHVRGRIRYWELGNEINDPHFYCSDMKTMVLMAKHAHAILKSISPQAQVLSPSVSGEPGPEWLGRFMAAGGGRYVDAIAFHGYWSTSAEDILPLVQRYRDVLAAHGSANTPVWDTEASWADFGLHPLQDHEARAAFLAKYYLLHWSANVTGLVWYAFDGGETWGGLWDKKTGLHEDANAYAQVYEWMVGAVMTKPCSLTSASVWTCSLERNGSRSCVAWSGAGATRFTPGGSVTGVVHLNGIQQPLQNGALLLDTAPVLIQGASCSVEDRSASNVPHIRINSFMAFSRGVSSAGSHTTHYQPREI